MLCSSPSRLDCFLFIFLFCRNKWKVDRLICFCGWIRCSFCRSLRCLLFRRFLFRCTLFCRLFFGCLFLGRTFFRRLFLSRLLFGCLLLGCLLFCRLFFRWRLFGYDRLLFLGRYNRKFIFGSRCRCYLIRRRGFRRVRCVWIIGIIFRCYFYFFFILGICLLYTSPSPRDCS